LPKSNRCTDDNSVEVVSRLITAARLCLRVNTAEARKANAIRKPGFEDRATIADLRHLPREDEERLGAPRLFTVWLKTEESSED